MKKKRSLVQMVTIGLTAGVLTFGSIMGLNNGCGYLLVKSNISNVEEKRGKPAAVQECEAYLKLQSRRGCDRIWSYASSNFCEDYIAMNKQSPSE